MLIYIIGFVPLFAYGAILILVQLSFLLTLVFAISVLFHEQLQMLRLKA